MSPTGEKRNAALLRPLPLVLLAAGGAAGALVAWPFALAGVAACVVSIALAPKPARSRRDLPATLPPPPAVRSTEVMAHVVRIRKGAEVLRRGLVDAQGPVRELLLPSAWRLHELVEDAWELAKKADEIRAKLDALRVTPEKEQVEDTIAAQYQRIVPELERIGSTLEGWHARVTHIAAETPEEAVKDSQGFESELEETEHLVRALRDGIRG